MAKTLILKDDETGEEINIAVDSVNNHHVIDASKLPLNTLVYDPSLQHTAPTTSAICFVDGDAGILQYRGYRIEDLVSRCNYLEVAYLLIYGELPGKVTLDHWHRAVMTHAYTHVKLNELMKAFNYDAHPMGMFISSLAALSTFHPEANPSLHGWDLYLNSADLVEKQIDRILGKSITLAANAYRHRIGRNYNAPQVGMGFVENFMYMLDRQGEEQEYKPHPILVEAMEKLFIIHAEHELNCSCSTLRHIASSLCDPFSCVAGAAAALYGPLHGGANEAVLEMLEEIASVEQVPAFLEAVKRKEKRLMGFGHRVYKNYDPRAAIIKDITRKVFDVCGKEPLIEVAVALEEVALRDSYFIERKLFPNIDYYSGLIYRAMGFPKDFFPLLFAIPRIAGWLAHWREMLVSESQALRIWRPRQIYTGKRNREFLELDARIDDCNVDNGLSSMYKRYVLSTRRGDD